MSLDKTLENVNLTLRDLSSSFNDLITVVRIGTILIVTALCFMIIGLTVLCCYVKCCQKHLTLFTCKYALCESRHVIRRATDVRKSTIFSENNEKSFLTA
ncbi:unnamed protein product [Thelazia callipaeda]|uniref:E protein n=1 Tax=Thelazia callipaeda TaxID=103827 RepID=A0A0N5CUV8_THECL|nr:unnamed protein product [Thelazia callipaeda]